MSPLILIDVFFVLVLVIGWRMRVRQDRRRACLEAITAEGDWVRARKVAEVTHIPLQAVYSILRGMEIDGLLVAMELPGEHPMYPMLAYRLGVRADRP